MVLNAIGSSYATATEQMGMFFCSPIHLEYPVTVQVLDKSCDSSDRIPSTTPGAELPRDARDSGSARSHSMHLETSSSDRP